MTDHIERHFERNEVKSRNLILTASEISPLRLTASVEMT